MSDTPPETRFRNDRNLCTYGTYARARVNVDAREPFLSFPNGRPADPDPRVTCTTCEHYRPHHCGNHAAAGLQGSDIAPDLAVLPQHCPGWKSRTPLDPKA